METIITQITRQKMSDNGWRFIDQSLTEEGAYYYSAFPIGHVKADESSGLRENYSLTFYRWKDNSYHRIVAEFLLFDGAYQLINGEDLKSEELFVVNSILNDTKFIRKMRVDAESRRKLRIGLI